MAPFLATIQAPDENRHRLIRRARLHLPVPRPRLATALTFEHVRPALLVAFQHGILTLHLLIGQLLPVFGIEFTRRHKGNLMRFKFTLLEASQKALVPDIGLRTQIRHRPPGNHLVDIGKIRVFPVLPDALFMGVLNGGIVDPLFEIDALGFVEFRCQMLFKNFGNVSSE